MHRVDQCTAIQSSLTLPACVGLCRSPVRSYSMHGPAGALLSIGLLRLIDWDTMERCVLSEYGTGNVHMAVWVKGAIV